MKITKKGSKTELFINTKKDFIIECPMCGLQHKFNKNKQVGRCLKFICTSKDHNNPIEFGCGTIIEIITSKP